MTRRFDTLFLRLFVLMWVTLVASHFIAYTTVTMVLGHRAPPPGAPADQSPLSVERLPTLPSLPPGNPFKGDANGAPPPPPPPHGARPAPPGPALPAWMRWSDYAIRMAVIALFAAVGARWLSSPMRRLARASAQLSDGLRAGQAIKLDEQRGTIEVRNTAAVFNRMVARLQEQFDARSLHMAALSHDLRTPLTRLRMRIEPLADERAQAAIDDIREMDEMIEATLAVLREQRDGTPAPALDLCALLQALADDLAAQGQPVSVDTAAPLSADTGAPLRVRAHPAALRRIVGNLVANALRHGGNARMAARALSPSAVEVTVDDDGPGIAPDAIPRAFEPWVRLHGEGARSGHGLGLAIARDLAERDGGSLTLANRPQGGLRARLVLPTA
jgi:signal transduction histidine kinase